MTAGETIMVTEPDMFPVRAVYSGTTEYATYTFSSPSNTYIFFSLLYFEPMDGFAGLRAGRGHNPASGRDTAVYYPGLGDSI